VYVISKLNTSYARRIGVPDSEILHPWTSGAGKLDEVGSAIESANGRVVGPGANILLKSLEPFDQTANAAVDLTTEQWVKVADAFHDWPFKPDVLEDETFVQDDDFSNARDTTIIPTREISEEARELLDAEEAMYAEEEEDLLDVTK